jgi:hypothetical protein
LQKVALVIPTQLQHYEDRRWFLATQVAEVHKQNVQSCQDFIDLAAMIVRGEFKTIPVATDTYILFGVGAKANDDAFHTLSGRPRTFRSTAKPNCATGMQKSRARGHNSKKKSRI